MIVGVKISVDVDSERWAKNNPGLWPQEDRSSLNTAVRHDIKRVVQERLQLIDKFTELGIEVRVS